MKSFGSLLIEQPSHFVNKGFVFSLVLSLRALNCSILSQNVTGKVTDSISRQTKKIKITNSINDLRDTT